MTKDAERDWSHLKAPILAEIMDHFTSGAPLIEDEEAARDEEVYEGETAQIVAEIKDLIDTRIRPAVAQDGGDILFSRFEPDTGVVWLNMRGACSGCPSSAATLKAGVENLLRHYVPEVTRVEQTLELSVRARHRHLPRRLPGRPLRGADGCWLAFARRWSAATRSGLPRWPPR